MAQGCLLVLFVDHLTQTAADPPKQGPPGKSYHFAELEIGDLQSLALLRQANVIPQPLVQCRTRT